MGVTAACTCHRVVLNSVDSDSAWMSRDWNPECPEHGTASAWWQSPEQVADRARRRAELVALQQRAAELRRR